MINGGSATPATAGASPMMPAFSASSFPPQLTPFYQSTPAYPFYTPALTGVQNLPGLPANATDEEEEEEEEEQEQKEEEQEDEEDEEEE